MIVQSKAQCCKRCAAVAHALVVDAVVVVARLVGTVQSGAGRLHIREGGIVCNLSLAYSTDEINVEEACHLELGAKLNAIILLLHICKRYVDERVDVVVKEVLPVGHVGHLCIVAVEVEVQPRVLVHISNLAVEHTLVLQSVNKVVVHLRSHEGIACLRCAILVAGTQRHNVATAEGDVRAKLQASVEEFGVMALAV